MIGFEAELSVPTFEIPYGLDDWGAIHSFLFGGYENTDVAAGFIEGSFKIKPDVSDYQPAGQAILRKLSEFYNVGEETGKFSNDVRITKMEYETYPIDEVTADSNTRFLAQADAIKEHSERFVEQAMVGIVEVPYPAGGMYAGVPVGQIQKVIDDNPDCEAVKALSDALNKMRTKTKFEFVIQATAGILPSVIPALFESDTNPLDRPGAKLTEVWATGYPLLRKFVNETMTSEWFKTDSWVTENLGDDVRKAAFKGHLYLIASYLVGDALTQTKLFDLMSAKNAVPYHAKINLGDFHQATPYKDAVPQSLAEQIAESLKGKDWVKSRFWVENLEIKMKERWDPEHLVYDIPYDFVVNALEGQKVKTFINQVGVPRPGDKKREHDKPDRAANNPGGESGVQLEFRRLGVTVGPAGLGQAFRDVVDQVRTINFPRLTPEAQRHLGTLMGRLST
jgi:hypothetical protein